MSNTLLSSEDFGLKIYERFPPAYRGIDEHYNLALKRYLQALSDGGFKYSIEELNGILDLVDPERTKAEVLPLLYNQYGLEVFNGIPENYLRYFLPFLSLAYSKKGSLSVIPFITTSLSGISTSIDITYDSYGNPQMDIELDMDNQIEGNNFFPKADQFNRILKNFLPFYVKHTVVYSYCFNDNVNIEVIDDITNKVRTLNGEQNSITNSEAFIDNVLSLNEDLIELSDIVREDNQCCLILNAVDSLLNNSSLISFDVIDKVNDKGTIGVLIPAYPQNVYFPITINHFNSTLERGSIRGTDGTLLDSKQRLRSVDFTELEAGTYTLSARLLNSNYAQLLAYIFTYDLNENFISRSYWSIPFEFILSEKSLVKFIIAADNFDNTYITLDDVDQVGILTKFY